MSAARLHGAEAWCNPHTTIPHGVPKRPHMSYSRNSLKGGYTGDYMGTTIGVIEGYTRSLDYSSY